MEDEEDMAEDVRLIADMEGAGRKIFDDEGAPDEGGDKAERFRLTVRPTAGSERSTFGTLATRPIGAPPASYTRLKGTSAEVEVDEEGSGALPVSRRT